MQLDINTLAIILAIVSLIITVIGFFASLWFYRDGIKSQNLANETLIKIQEKAESIHGEVGGMSDKMLQAIIDQNKLSHDFAVINQQIEQASQEIKEAALQEIGAAGESERERISAIVDRQMSRLREQVSKTQESAQAISDRAVEEVRGSRIEILQSDLQDRYQLLARLEAKAATYNVNQVPRYLQNQITYQEFIIEQYETELEVLQLVEQVG